MFSPQEAWIDLISMASFADRVVQLGEGRSISLYKGEILASQRQLAARWSWSPAKVNRYLHRLSAGTPPQIECYTRRVVILLSETPNETPNETPSETLASVIKISECADYDNSREIHETPSETADETIYNKDIEEGYMNDTHSICLVEFFGRVRAMRTREDVGAVAELAKRAEAEVQSSPEARRIFDSLNVAHKGLFWAWRTYPELMCSFAVPCRLGDFEQISRSYEFEDMKNVIEAMANKLPQRGSRLGSFIATFKQWAALDHRIRRKAVLGNPRYVKMS